MSLADDRRFRQIGERPRYEGGFLRLVTGTFVDPDGFTFERDLVRHAGAVCVVPLEADGEHVIVLRQYRGALDRALLEIPAGKLDVAGEAADLCAHRELREEVGRQAGSLVEIGGFYNSPGFTDEFTVCFLAEDLIAGVREPHGVEERNATVERISLSEVEELMAAGELLDGKTIISLLLTRGTLARRNRASEPTPS